MPHPSQIQRRCPHHLAAAAFGAVAAGLAVVVPVADATG
jgi:hypothetical protein